MIINLVSQFYKDFDSISQFVCQVDGPEPLIVHKIFKCLKGIPLLATAEHNVMVDKRLEIIEVVRKALIHKELTVYDTDTTEDVKIEIINYVSSFPMCYHEMFVRIV